MDEMPENMRKQFLKRIGEVEKQYTKQTPGIITQIPRPVAQPYAQAPSTQRILDEIANETPIVARAMKPPADRIDKETGRAMVATGKGTSGPRKF